MIFLLLLALPACTHSPTLKEYIADQHVVVTADKPAPDFRKIFGDELATGRVFFSSEEHAVAGNKLLEKSLLEYFVREAGVRYLLVEHGYCQAMLFNSYLATGNAAILQEELAGLKGTLSYTQDFYQHWQQLYQLNHTLENKITVIGIDLEWLPSVHAYLNTSLQGVDLNEVPSLEKLLSEYDDRKPSAEYLKIFEQIVAEFESIRDKQGFTEKQQFEIPYIFSNLIRSVEVFAEAEHLDTHRKRDRYMAENFITLYARLPKGNYFGQWGLNHVYQSPQLGVAWLGHLLNTREDSPVKGHVISMAAYYKNCTRIKWRTDTTEILDNFSVSDDSLGLSFRPESIYLFRLDAQNSPFQKGLLWYGPHPPERGVTTDYYQYLIVHNEFEASRPFAP